jgi:uncharacterized sporulation protein YeaH/YhbH (DUF444 family)
MDTFIDRRQDGKGKSIPNRKRFIDRYKKQIAKSVAGSISKKGIREIDEGRSVNIPAKDLAEPTFGHDPKKGIREVIHPGNKEFVKGDKIPRPAGGGVGGSGNGRASNSGEGEDDFIFELSREEFLEIFFEDLELPYLARLQLAKATEFKSVRAGFARVGPSSRIHIIRSLKGSIARRIALSGSHKKRIAEIEIELQNFRAQGVPEDDRLILDLLKELEYERGRIRALPFMDTFDLRYVNHVSQPQPTTQAVMFCIMDVSGSMDRARKDLAKRFFTLLYLFLTRSYEKIDVVFIRHHTAAKEVDEQEFFYGKETGGTVVSSALTLMDDIQKARYPVSSWNLYMAQASDGDNWYGDSPACGDILIKLLERFRYGAYVEITPDRHQQLWEVYEDVGKKCPNFGMRQIDGPADIYPVFRDLFKKRVN